VPTQIRFYGGCWIDVLKDAKHLYRLFIHTEEPFPERSRESLADAHQRLVDSIGKFQEETRLPLDEGLCDASFQEFTNCFIDVYKIHCSDMDVLVSGFREI
jgi:hypothetical protein